MSEFKQIDGQDIIQMIRLLGELTAAGLSEEQYRFLGESADLKRWDVDGILANADNAYEVIKDLAANGYVFSDKPATKEELKQVARTEDRVVQRIVFPSDSDLDFDEYSESKNDVFNTLLTDDEVSLGATYGLYYRPLLSGIPFVAEGDIPSDQVDDLLDD